MTTFFYILLALVVLLVLITVHEFGHYCAGKIFGFKINEFSIGFGPAIFKRTRKDGELFSIRALPLGGYCAFEGEDEDGKDKPGSFNTMAGWKRLVVLLAGITFNFLFAVVTAGIYLAVSGFTTAQITSTISQQGITTAGFQKNDVVISVSGKKVEAYRSFQSLISKYGENEEFVVTVDRNGEIIDITTKKQQFPAFYFVSYNGNLEGKLFDENGEAISIEEFSNEIIRCNTSVENEDNLGTGVALKAYLSTVYKDKEKKANYGNDEDIKLLLNGDAENNIYASISYSKAGLGIGIIQTYKAQKYGFFEAFAKAVPFCFYLCGLILSSLAGLFAGKVSLKEAGGTITAVSQIAEISQMGINYFLLLLPLLSVNLAMFNVLPIPSLDGARVVFVLIEMIFRKPVPRQIEGWIHTIGLFVLLALVIFLDINHFLTASIILQL